MPGTEKEMGEFPGDNFDVCAYSTLEPPFSNVPGVLSRKYTSDAIRSLKEMQLSFSGEFSTCRRPIHGPYLMAPWLRAQKASYEEELAIAHQGTMHDVLGSEKENNSYVKSSCETSYAHARKLDYHSREPLKR